MAAFPGEMHLIYLLLLPFTFCVRLTFPLSCRNSNIEYIYWLQKLITHHAFNSIQRSRQKSAEQSDLRTLVTTFYWISLLENSIDFKYSYIAIETVKAKKRCKTNLSTNEHICVNNNENIYIYIYISEISNLLKSDKLNNTFEKIIKHYIYKHFT